MNSLRQFTVWIGQTLVGNIVELPNDQNLFAFNEQYVEDPQRPVLSFSFFDEREQLVLNPEVHQGRVAPFFSNLLPEGRLREYLAQQAGVKKMRDLPLLQVVGNDLPGAVVIRPEQEGPPNLDEDEQRQPLDDGQPLRFSLAGVQMKFSAIGSPERGLTLPAGGRGGHWIIKLPGEQFRMIPENEHSMLTFARKVGIEVADSGLVPVTEIEGLPSMFQNIGANALWVKRFDRTEHGRIHMEDFNQLYGQYPEDKYEHYSYMNMASDLNRIAGLAAAQELIRRIVFSAAIGNADMHLKNWTLLYSDGRTPQLSPAYDFVSTIAHINEDKNMALSLVRKIKNVNRFDESLWKRFADRAALPQEAVLHAALETSQTIVEVWRRIRGDLVMEERAKDLIDEQMKYFPLTRKFL